VAAVAHPPIRYFWLEIDDDVNVIDRYWLP